VTRSRIDGAILIGAGGGGGGGGAPDAHASTHYDTGTDPLRGPIVLTASGPAVKPLVLKAAASQTANVLEIQNSAGAAMARFTSNGRLILGTNGASTYQLGMPNGAGMAWRNAANSADILAVYVGADDVTNLNSNGPYMRLQFNVTQVVTLSPTWMLFAEAVDIMFGTATGTKLGTAANQKIGAFGAAPIVRPTGTPAAATDAATTQILANFLRTALLNLGWIG
jgi:hypothetical protein